MCFLCIMIINKTDMRMYKKITCCLNLLLIAYLLEFFINQRVDISQLYKFLAFAITNSDKQNWSWTCSACLAKMQIKVSPFLSFVFCPVF